MQFKIRNVRNEDINKIVEINRKCLPENYSVEYFYYHLKEYPDLFLVATILEKEEKIVGYCMSRLEFGLSNFNLSFIKKGHIVSIAVLSEYRKRGIGFSLMKYTLNKLKDYKVKEVYLEVRVSNIPAINLYRKLNFQITERIKEYYSDGEDAFVMSYKENNL